MDYDDNDFQSQNVHLAGEGSTKYPPVLRPYALPKFDFDDSLQAHLRFDSLVETEVFLGIESNEDNRWIDDFSRGSSGIEFSSSAAESCSISRRHNVWSEATSSESVEMLLKSVGQEEIIPAQTIIKESDACDLPGCLTSEMEPSLKHDDNVLSKTKDVTDVQSTLPADEIPGNFSGLEGDVEEDQSLVKVDSETQEDKLFVDGSSNDMDPNAVSRKHGLHETDRSVFPDSRCDNAHKMEVDTSNDNNMDVKTQQDSFASGMMVDNLLTSVQNIITSRSEQNNNDVQHQVNVSIENLGGHVLSKEAQMNDQNMDENLVDNATCNHEKLFCSESKVETVAEASAVEDIKISGNLPSSNILKGHSYHHMEEGCSEGECSGVPVETSKCEDMLLCKDIDVSGDQPEVNIHELSAVSVTDGARFEGSAVKASYTSAEIPSNLEPEMDSSMTITHGEGRHKEDTLQSDQQLNIGRSEASLSSIDANKFSKDEGHESSQSFMGGISNLSIMCSIAEVDNDTLVTGASEGVNNTCEVSTENLTAEDHVSPPTEINPSQICEENKASEDGNINRCDRDAFVSKKENAKLPNESRDMDGDIEGSLGTGVGSSSLDEGRKEDKLIASELQHPTAVGSGSDVNVGYSIFPSCDTSTPVALSSGNVVEVDIGHEEVCVPPQSVVQLTDLDKKEEATSNTSKEASISSHMGSSQVETGPGPISEAKEGVSCDIAGAANEVGKGSTKEIDVYPVLCESTQKEVDVGEAPESHNVATSDKNLTQESADSAEPATTNDEMLTQPGSLLLEEMCSGKAQNAQEGCEATLISGSNNSGQTSEPNATGSLCSDPLPESHAKLVSQDNGGSSVDHCKPIRGSPNLSPSVYGKGVVKGSINQNVPVSEVVDLDVGNASSNSYDTKGHDTSKDGISGNFDVSSLAELSKGDTGKNWPSIPPMVAPKIAEEPPSNSGSGQMDAKITQDISQAGMQVSGEEVRGRSKGTPERKTRRSSGKATGRNSSKKGIHVKETTPVRQSEKGDKVSNISVGPSGIFQLMQPNEMPQYGHVEGSNAKPYFLLGPSTSSLPDLNTSASPSAVFQQPFTDMQQVQLRAQIFVYGALIQGTAPEEAYMASAFGGSDVARSTWENAWHACIARVNGQTSNLNQETPLYSRSGPRASEQVIKQSAAQSKGISPAGRASTKGTQPNINPMIPLSSPLWNISTPSGDALQSTVMPRGSVLDYQQSLTPLHPFQTPPMRNLVGHNTSWMSQGPFRGTWVASPQPALPEASTRFSTLPSTEAVQLTPPQETSIPHSSGIKHASGPLVHSGGPTSVFAAPSPLLDPKNVVSSAGQHSTDPKSRKRKKNPVSQELGHINLQSQSQSQPVLASVDTNSLSTSVTIATPKTLVPKPISDNIVMSISAASSEHLKRVEQNVVQRSNLSEETLSKIKETKKQAEDAAALAVTAISHSQDIWNQLDKQKNSGLTSDVEAKLASAAVAVAAAAAVARAAAAAANVASNAALQAKLMADEALILSSIGSSSQYARVSSSDGENVLGKATPASILRGEDGANSSSSVIFAAREAAKRKVEAASAASKRAENMDAIVKAAELAAEAVSQAGKIVAMGDPLPLSELVEAGPEGYWKIPQASFERVGKSIEMIREQSNSVTVGEFANASAQHSKEELSGKKETQTSANGRSLVSKEATKELTDHNVTLVDGISGSVASGKKESRGQKGRKVSDLAPNISVILEPEIGLKSSTGTVENEFEKAAEASEANNINEGSQVEVFKDGNGYKAAWFTAKVLSVEDGKAYVCYTEIQSDEGLGQLKEWVALKDDGNKAPKIRNARPLTAMRYEGTRKRRRAAIGDYTWSVGDKVDAWITDSWWEGVVTEKNKKDETTLTVHFPAQGETSVVKAWHLRPSLIWKDGEWVEFSNLQNDSSSHEGDMPQEKRLKLGSPAVEAKGKDKISKSIDAVSSGKLEESRLLDLSANDKVFNIGKNSRNENKLDASRTVRTGLRKEGSRVVIGVPKPGKKRKFMEVSKHYVADQSNKVNEVNDSAKLVKYLMPQGSGSRGLKSTKTDAKDKRVAESKLKGLKSGKPQSVSSRTVPQKNSLSNAVSAHNDTPVTDNTLCHAENSSGKQSQMETGSFSSMEEAPQGPVVFSSSNAKPERANKGKLAPAGGKLGKIEEDRVFHGDNIKSTSEAVEPRRSIRRIQPTSRLLEGLQSSLIISKIPSVSHDKGHRSQKNTPRGNNHG